MRRHLMPFGNALAVPDELLRNVISQHGATAVDGWFERLPAMLETWCAAWEITLSDEVPGSGYNVMAYGESALAGPVVLKMNLPSPEVLSEMESIAQGSGHGIVRLLAADPAFAIMMLERVDPGTPLRVSGLTDQDATAVAADVMRRFWREPARPDNLFALGEWMASLLNYPARPTYPVGPIPAHLIDRAIKTAQTLLAMSTDLVLLHGDVHHDNILWGGDRGWVTIDPKGLIGERGFETGTWMHNPMGIGLHAEIGAILRERIATFARLLDLDPYRTAQWSFVFLVLSMCWTTEAEGHGDLSSTMTCALEMERIMDERRP